MCIIYSLWKWTRARIYIFCISGIWVKICFTWVPNVNMNDIMLIFHNTQTNYNNITFLNITIRMWYSLDHVFMSIVKVSWLMSLAMKNLLIRDQLLRRIWTASCCCKHQEGLHQFWSLLGLFPETAVQVRCKQVLFQKSKRKIEGRKFPETQFMKLINKKDNK